jgi:uncharacterized protein YbbK (DUF523 family)
VSVKLSKPLVGISSCLLGEKVRYDGNHQAQPELLNWLAGHVRLQSFCPEVSAGFGVPRPAIHLVIKNQAVACIQVDEPQADLTEPLLAGFTPYRDQFKLLSGFILKSRSPSCGLGGVKLSGILGQYRNGQGLFAHWLTSQFPDMPLVSEQQLTTLQQRQQFLHAVQKYDRRLSGYG